MVVFDLNVFGQPSARIIKGLMISFQKDLPYKLQQLLMFTEKCLEAEVKSTQIDKDFRKTFCSHNYSCMAFNVIRITGKLWLWIQTYQF